MKKSGLMLSFLWISSVWCSSLNTEKQSTPAFSRSASQALLPRQRFLDLFASYKASKKAQSSPIEIEKIADTTPYNEATFLVAHNAHASKAYGWRYRQQNWSITALLNYGVRGIMLDVHRYKNDAYLCHGPCETITKLQRSPLEAVKSFVGYDPQYQSLRSALEEIKKWMGKNSSHIVTLFLENYVDDQLIQKLLQETIQNLVFTPQDLAHYRKDHRAQHWPSLDYLREGNKRIICFNEKKGGMKLRDSVQPLFFYTYQHIIESSFGSTVVDICRQREESAREDKTPRYLYMLNFFSYPSSEKDAKINNNKDRLLRVIKQCTTASVSGDAYVPFDKKPNFIALDFVEIGDGLEVAKLLNQKTLHQIKTESAGTEKEALTTHAASSKLSFLARFYNSFRESYNYFFKK